MVLFPGFRNDKRHFRVPACSAGAIMVSLTVSAWRPLADRWQGCLQKRPIGGVVSFFRPGITKRLQVLSKFIRARRGDLDPG